jgi:negative regulator of sigma E activity
MERTNGWLRIAIAPLAIASLVVWGGSATGAEFSADIVEKMHGQQISGKVYVKGDKIRREAVRGGKEGVIIMRLDRKVVWNLMPDQKKYVEIPNMNPAQFDSPETRKELERIADRKELGTEKVSGYDCQKIQYVYHDKSLGTLTQWVAKKLKYPIKMEHKGQAGEMSMEYRNIKEGSVSDSLFDLPKGYEKMEMPGRGQGRGGAPPR